VGGSGYAGGELLRLLSGSPALSLRTVAGRASAGRPLAEAFPNLGLAGLVEPAEAGVFDACELVFLATPHEASLQLAPPLVAAGVRVVDLSGAYRLDPGTFAVAYGQAHPCPELTPAPYGLPELFRDDLAGAALVANPGCYPTAALLALAPLAGLVKPGSVHITGLSGTSGAGKGLRDDLHASHAAGNVAVYATPGHRHTPEIEAAWDRLTGTPATVTFTPVLLPLARGMLVTVTAGLLDEVDAEAVTEKFAQAYAREPFVGVVAPGSWPQTAYTRGANSAAIGVAVDPRTGRVTVACALDNLVKGAAGQAIQNANLLCGLPEATGLPVAGMYP
jgi:N-acetyl-gamma-glutamyl-phosphate reductase